MNKLLIFLLALMPALVFAQPGVTPVKEVNGKRYYEHKVESGNTLYGLQRTYGVSVDEIVASNPELKNGLKVGQTVLIPVTQESISKIPTVDYKVQKGETMYGISKKLEVSIDDLLALNPDVASSGLQKGQTIKVPASANQKPDSVEEVVEITPVDPETPNPFVVDTIVKADGSEHAVKFTFSDSTVRHIVMAHETMYSISKRFMVPIDKIVEINGLTSTSVKEGQVLIIPVKSEKLERVEIKGVPEVKVEGRPTFEKKSEYEVVMLLPFLLDGGENYSKRVSELATQFYMGAKMALDSLEKKGLRANVHVLDTKNDSLSLARILSDEKMKNVDLIIGPFFENNVAQVASFCKENGIRLVVPTAVDESVLIDNPYVYQAVPTSEDLMSLLAIRMLEKNKKDHIVLVKSDKESDLPMYEAYKKAFNETPVNGTRPVLIEATLSSFSGNIRRGANTVFIIPTNDKQTALKFMNALNKVAYKGSPNSIYVYGTKEWVNFTEVNNMYKNKYNFHYPSPNFLDYYSDMGIKLNKKHREWYKTDLSRLAVHGYDVVTYFCTDFFLEGKKPRTVMTKFQMEPLGENDGFANRGLYVIEQEEYELLDSDIERKDDK